jgi:hypothetical protein
VSDPTTRSAAKLAALVAVPIALVVGVIVFFSFHDRVVSAANARATSAPSALSTTDSVPVPMVAPTLSPADALACGSFIGQLPQTLDKLSPRHITAGLQQNAAFGDPAITVACGGPQPKVGLTDEVFQASGVCWIAQTGKTATVLTTVDRAQPVTVTVPNSYGDGGQLQWANQFWKPIEAAIASIKTPYNC